jgi:hypothetical protein
MILSLLSKAGLGDRGSVEWRSVGSSKTTSFKYTTVVNYAAGSFNFIPFTRENKSNRNN